MLNTTPDEEEADQETEERPYHSEDGACAPDLHPALLEAYWSGTISRMEADYMNIFLNINGGA